MTDPLLSVRDLRTVFYMEDGAAPAVDGVSFDLREGETLGLVGESGCGKSVTSLSILRLVSPPGRTEGGRVLFEGRDLLGLDEREMRRVRGNRIAMIFQEPMTSLNPAFTCGDQIDEAVRLHLGLDARAARERTVDLLREVGIPAPEQCADEYPHRLSGGMRQRVMIAMALSCNPSLLIADEPTTALDVTIQAQILDLLKRLQASAGMAVLMITHDLGVIAEVADRVAVMYAGRIVERAEAASLFQTPRHPYTRGLLASRPRLSERRDRLEAIPGAVPDPAHFPTGCRFHPRCPLADDRCRGESPPLLGVAPGHAVACWNAEGYRAS